MRKLPKPTKSITVVIRDMLMGKWYPEVSWMESIALCQPPKNIGKKPKHLEGNHPEEVK